MLDVVERTDLLHRRHPGLGIDSERNITWPR